MVDVTILLLQVTLAEPVLVEWSKSPLYLAVIVTVPRKPVFGVNVTEHVPETRAQLVDGVKVPDDGGACVRVIVPAGVTAVPGELSATVMTQRVGVLTSVAEGVQTTAVEVERCVTSSVV